MTPAERALTMRFINLPTAPFVETAGLRFIRNFVQKRPALSARFDRFGNLLIHYRRGKLARGVRPVLLAAHLDHPGFVAESRLDSRTLQAAWHGGVKSEFFKKARVRFWNGAAWIPGKVAELMVGDDKLPQSALVQIRGDVPAGSPGMWDFPDARVINGRLHARACDDVVGAAGILCLLDRLCRKKMAGECYAFFTRAEEVGFGGALAAVKARTLPRRAIVVAIECSKAIVGVAVGGGPVLRVGDKATIFTPSATAYCQTVAEDLAKHDPPSFRFQRKLMDGGTCESTAYCHYGYDATGICLPLLNYHNMDLERGRLAPEIIDMSDLRHLVDWFEALVRTERRFDGRHPGLSERLEKLHKLNTPKLVATRRRVLPD